MGRQVRKVSPWMGMFESHLHSNHVIHRLYRWTTYHSHPTMRVGAPFKGRGTGRPYPGVLLTPDAIKYHIPIPFAFVAVNNKYNPRTQNTHHSETQSAPQTMLLSAGQFKNDQSCQKQVLNFNKCLRNAQAENCDYYLNYLNNFCSMSQ